MVIAEEGIEYTSVQAQKWQIKTWSTANKNYHHGKHVLK
jgi:hypothetical protein